MHNLIPIWGFDQRGKLIDRIEAYLPVKAAENLFVGRYISNACELGELGDLVH